MRSNNNINLNPNKTTYTSENNERLKRIDNSPQNLTEFIRRINWKTGRRRHLESFDNAIMHNTWKLHQSH
jgi:hypothetical protein